MKDAMGHGSNNRGGPKKPIPQHPYHLMPDVNLRYIMKDAHEAGRNAQEMGDNRGVNKYADQVNDAATVLAYRRAGGEQDKTAADTLHSGTSKSNAVPVHDAMSAYEGRHDEDIRLGAKYGFDRPTKIGSGI